MLEGPDSPDGNKNNNIFVVPNLYTEISIETTIQLVDDRSVQELTAHIQIENIIENKFLTKNIHQFYNRNQTTYTNFNSRTHTSDARSHSVFHRSIFSVEGVINRICEIQSSVNNRSDNETQYHQ
jgi:hypothetical protein